MNVLRLGIPKSLQNLALHILLLCFLRSESSHLAIHLALRKDLATCGDLLLLKISLPLRHQSLMRSFVALKLLFGFSLHLLPYLFEYLLFELQNVNGLDFWLHRRLLLRARWLGRLWLWLLLPLGWLGHLQVRGCTGMALRVGSRPLLDEAFKVAGDHELGLLGAERLDVIGFLVRNDRHVSQFLQSLLQWINHGPHAEVIHGLLATKVVFVDLRRQQLLAFELPLHLITSRLHLPQVLRELAVIKGAAKSLEDQVARLGKRRCGVDGLFKIGSGRVQLAGQRSRHPAQCFLAGDQALESLLHLALDLVRLHLHFSHLLLDLLYALPNDVRIKVVFHQLWIEAAIEHWVWAHLAASKGILLQLNDLLKLVDLAADIRRASLGILVEYLHFVQLGVDWSHHFEHHAPIIIEYILLYICGRLLSS